MGKIRIKTFGNEELEKPKKQKEKKKTANAPKLKSAKAAVVSPSAQNLEQLPASQSDNKLTTQVKTDKQVDEKRKEKKEKKRKRSRSKKYQAATTLVDKTRTYSLSEALELLPKLKLSKIDETVELHINLERTGIFGNVTLPHGTGKKTKVVIATDSLVAEIEKGKIDFDVLISTPDMMPKLAKVAKILGPRGLMPNPKNGTISDSPEELAKKYEGGQMNIKTEAKTPIMHIALGKLSYDKKKLMENIETILNAVKKQNIQKAVLKSTMSPAIKIQV